MSLGRAIGSERSFLERVFEPALKDASVDLAAEERERLDGLVDERRRVVGGREPVGAGRHGLRAPRRVCGRLDGQAVARDGEDGDDPSVLPYGRGLRLLRSDRAQQPHEGTTALAAAWATDA